MAEKEYIERGALIAEYDRVHIGPAGGARKLMEEAPAADVVEVVRCNKCEHWIVERKACAFVGKDLFGDLPPETFFCARGERKEDVKL